MLHYAAPLIKEDGQTESPVADRLLRMAELEATQNNLLMVLGLSIFC